MKGFWRLPFGRNSAPVWTLKEVLIDYDGPQLATFETANDLFLGLAVDDDEQSVRWLYTPLTHIELDALRSGALPTREPFLKGPVWVVDQTASGNPKEAWYVAGGDLPDEALPARGVLLPSDVRRAPKAFANPTFVFGAGGPKELLSLGQLGPVTSAIQRLWNALYASVTGRSRTTGPFGYEVERAAAMYAFAASPGSLQLEVLPGDSVSFDRLSEAYVALVSAGDDPARLSVAIRGMHPRALSAYAAYLDTLAGQEVEVFSALAGRMAYVGPSIARRASPAVRVARTTQSLEFRASGAFLGFSIERKTFDFRDADADETYSGQLSAELVEEFLATGRDVKVGTASYSASLREVRTANVGAPRTTYELLQFIEYKAG